MSTTLPLQTDRSAWKENPRTSFTKNESLEYRRVCSDSCPCRNYREEPFCSHFTSDILQEIIEDLEA
ncbi:hypothetical protein [Pleomorphochaeta sp. DL1XJH-081]|uniref:hypothetical protein n=1 Tax=Pleomorphochaeta sp. DL1XJH-081 TaxID=3409690 RepID=UPI003BB77A2A